MQLLPPSLLFARVSCVQDSETRGKSHGQVELSTSNTTIPNKCKPSSEHKASQPTQASVQKTLLGGKSRESSRSPEESSNAKPIHAQQKVSSSLNCRVRVRAMVFSAFHLFMLTSWRIAMAKASQLQKPKSQTPLAWGTSSQENSPAGR